MVYTSAMLDLYSNSHDNLNLLIPDLLLGIGLRLLAIVAVILVLTVIGGCKIFKFCHAI
jgi:hypothetical protein